jgi:divalent metal cation (Fe/Co/Zn/Cd) transporter
MIVGMLVSAAIAAFGLLVALGLVGHPIDAQLVSNYGWSILIIGVALFVLFAWARFNRSRRDRSAGRSA